MTTFIPGLKKAIMYFWQAATWSGFNPRSDRLQNRPSEKYSKLEMMFGTHWKKILPAINEVIRFKASELDHNLATALTSA